MNMLTYDEYKIFVDHELEKICGFNSDCLADYDLYSLYMGEVPAVDAAHIIILEDGTFEDLL